jgi:transposase
MLKNSPVPMPTQYKAIKPGANGVKYVYHITKTYCEAGKRKYDCVCIGKMEEITGLLIPNEQYYKYYQRNNLLLSKDNNIYPAYSRENLINNNLVIPNEAIHLHYGSCLALKHLANDVGLTEILSEIFPQNYEQILKIAIYMVSEGNIMSNIDIWQEYTEHNLGPFIDDSACSQIFASLKFSDRMEFFQKWMEMHACDGNILYDVTIIQSYSKNIPRVQYGYRGKHEKLPQINLGMYYGQTSGLPIYYHIYQGSITDKTDLIYMVDHTKTLGLKNVLFVIDRGFYTDLNLKYLYKNGFNFIIPLPSSRKIYKTLLNTNYSNIRFNENRIPEFNIYGKSYDQQIAGLNVNAHIFYDIEKIKTDEQEIFDKIDKLKSELEGIKKGKKLPSKFHNFFNIVNDSQNSNTLPITYAINNDKINDLLNHTGFFILLSSNNFLSSSKVLDMYRKRDAIEKQFMTFKNYLDFKRFRTQSDKTVDGKMFVQFLSLILQTALFNKIKSNKLNKMLKKLSIDKILLYLK